jgi:branched-chain amino acid transport system ATP-binding protein
MSAAPSSVALRCTGVTVAFGALKAVDDVTYDFRGGCFYGLIGPNGAGKTTFLNVLAGRLMQPSGRIECNGINITQLKPHQRAHLGIGRSFQITKIFPEMTVLENLRIAAQVTRGRWMPMWPSAAYDRRLAADIDAMLELTDLPRYRDAIAGTLSYGLQRALELGVTLMPDPSILLLDEPLAGVGHHEIAGATALIQTAAKGRTVLLIEHNMDVVMRLSERVVVMAAGRIVADGPPAEIRDNALVRSVYLGEDDANQDTGINEEVNA